MLNRQTPLPLYFQLENAILLKRLRLADNEPLAVEKAYLSYRLCMPTLEEEFQDRSLYAVLIDKCAIIPTRAIRLWEATACPKEESRLLSISRGDLVLYIY